MKRILFILLLTILFIGCGEKVQRYHVDETTSPNYKLTYLKKDMSVVNGIVFDTVYNGQLIDEDNYKDGKRDGLCKSWYKNGQLKDDGNYKDGKREGLWKSYYENGQLKDEGNFKDGELISQKCWDEKGKEIECE